MSHHMGSQCYLPPNTSEHTLLYPNDRPVLDLPTLEGEKVEFTHVTSYILRWTTRSQMVSSSRCLLS